MKNLVHPIKAYFYNLRMRNKIILLFLPTIIASTMLTGFISYYAAVSIIEKNIYNNTSETIQQTVNFLNEKMNSVIMHVNSLQLNRDFATSIKNITIEEQINYALEFSRIEPILTEIKVRDKFVHSLFVYTPKGIFYNLSSVLRPGLDVSKTELYGKVQEDGLIYWGVAGKDEIFLSNDYIIPVIMKVTIYGTETNDMFIGVNLNNKEVVDFLTNISAKTKGEIYILNSDNKVVAAVKNGRYSKMLSNQLFLDRLNSNESLYFKYDNKDSLLVNVSTFPINKWKMVNIIRENDIKSDIDMIKLITIFSVSIFILIAAISSVLLAGSITKPLRRLQKIMEQSTCQYFNLRFGAKYNDEVGQLGTSFDSMSDQIQILLAELKQEQENVKEEQKSKRKAELRALQAQINPHFLYNALDTIYWRSVMQGNELVSEMAISLSNLFRIGLNKGKEITTIQKEIQHVESYLYIQKIVYEGKFDYKVNADKDIFDCKTVKLILQPLVENSIIHGFKDMKSGGLITVNVRREADKILFEVIDNGCGIQNESLKEALDNPSKGYDGYALGNVFQRIKLNYGDECGFTFSSKPYSETRITIAIPAVKEEENV